MNLTAQQTRRASYEKRSAMSSAGISEHDDATTCIGVVNSMASEPTPAVVLPRRERPIRIAPTLAQAKRWRWIPGSHSTTSCRSRGRDIALVCGKQGADQVEAVDRGHPKAPQIAREISRVRWW